VDERSGLRVRRHAISSVVTTCAVVIGLLLMSLADGAPFRFVRPERVTDLGAGALPNHQGDGNALTPESLARRATAATTPPSAAPATTPTTAMLVADLLALRAPTSSTVLPPTPPTPPTTVVDPRDGSGRGDRGTTGVRAARRAHGPHQAHIPQLDNHGEHVKHLAHAPHRKHPEHVPAPKHHLPPGRRSSTSRCS
jgi:hypothetical protein